MAVIQPLTIAILYHFIFPKLHFTLLSLHFILLLVLPETELAKLLVSKQLRGMKKKRWQISEQMLASSEGYVGQQDISSWINTWSSGITHWKHFDSFSMCTSENAMLYSEKIRGTAKRSLCFSLCVFESIWSMIVKRGRFSTHFISSFLCMGVCCLSILCYYFSLHNFFS